MLGRLLALLTLMSMTAASSEPAAKIPSFVGETLAGRHIRLPFDIVKPAAILIVGFTQKAAEQAESWATEVGKFHGCGDEQLVQWYEMPV